MCQANEYNFHTFIHQCHIKNPLQIKVEESQPHNIQTGKRILFKTRNSDHALKADTFVEDFVHISVEAASYLAEKQVRTIGVDSICRWL